MKKLLIILIISLFASSFLSAGEGPNVKPGEIAPEINLMDSDGNKVSLSNYIGVKPVIISFSATYCKPCLKEIPFLKTESKNGEAFVLIVFMIDTKNEKSMDSFFKKAGVKHPYINDVNGQVISSYNPVQLPTTIYIGKSGVIAAVETKFSPEKKAEYLNIIKSLEAK